MQQDGDAQLALLKALARHVSGRRMIGIGTDQPAVVVEVLIHAVHIVKEIGILVVETVDR
jgi:hypothetical protein